MTIFRFDDLIIKKLKTKKKKTELLNVFVDTCKTYRLFCDKCIKRIIVGDKILVLRTSETNSVSLCYVCGSLWAEEIKQKLNT